VLARAENVALARGAFDRAMKMWPDEDVRLRCGDLVLVTSAKAPCNASASVFLFSCTCMGNLVKSPWF
jgi:hypothetical protein